MKAYYILILFLSLLSVTTVVNAAAPLASDWWLIDESKYFIGDDEKTVKASVVTIDPKDLNIRVVSVPFELKKTAVHSEYDDFSLRSFAQTILTLPKYHEKDWIVVNGGFSSYRVDVPLGLLIVDGNVYSIAENENVETETTAASKIAGDRRWNGIICQRKDDNNWDIITTTNYQPGMCKQALQAGPLIVKPDNTIGISSGEPQSKFPYSRTVMCLLEDSRIKFVISEKTHLLHLAQWLSKPESEGGLGCRVAINLSGDTSSGIAIKSSRKADIRYIGDGSFPLPSALIIERITK